MKFKMLNAVLKLNNYIQFNGALPDAAELAPLILRSSARSCASIWLPW